MSATITATNPTELRQEVESLLQAGMAMGGAPLLAITAVEPDFEYTQTCDDPGCATGATGRRCQPPVDSDCRTAGLTLQGLETAWASRGATGARARQWDPENHMATEALSDWEYDSATAAAQTIGFDLTNEGAHSSMRSQEFWIAGNMLVVITSSHEHGEVMHTIEPIIPMTPRNREARRKQARSAKKGRRR